MEALPGAPLTPPKSLYREGRNALVCRVQAQTDKMGIMHDT
jgi:hypothetical protein